MDIFKQPQDSNKLYREPTPMYLSLILSMFRPPLSLPNALQQAFYSRSWEPCTDHMLMTQLGQDHGDIYFISTPALWKECRPQTTVQEALTQSACQRAGVSLRRRELPSVCGGLHLIPNTAKLNKKMNEQVQLGQWCKRILSKKRVKKLPWEELTSLQESELCHVRDVYSAFLWLLPVGKMTQLLLALQMRARGSKRRAAYPESSHETVSLTLDNLQESVVRLCFLRHHMLESPNMERSSWCLKTSPLLTSFYGVRWGRVYRWRRKLVLILSGSEPGELH